MDVISHGLWGGVAFGRSKKKFFLIAFGFGLLPDLFAFSFEFIQRIFLGSIPTGPIFSIPNYVYQLYNFSHSLIIAGVMFLLIFSVFKKKALPVLAWPLHILFDIPTHDVNFFATPFLWPFETPFFSGIPWNTPWIFFMDWGLIIILYLAWYLIKRRNRF